MGGFVKIAVEYADKLSAFAVLFLVMVSGAAALAKEQLVLGSRYHELKGSYGKVAAALEAATKELATTREELAVLRRERELGLWGIYPQQPHRPTARHRIRRKEV